MWTYGARNTMLGALSNWYFSAHSSYPTDTGSNELSGGSYARVLGTVNAASGGARNLNAAVNINIPAGSTVQWNCVFDALTSGNCIALLPAGGSPFKILTDTTNNWIFAPAHGLSNTNQIVFWGEGLAPGGLTKGTIYYVVSSATDSFKVSATSGGSAISLTSNGGPDCYCSQIIPESFGGAGIYQVSTAAFALND